MYSGVEPNAWIALKLPSDQMRVLQVVPNKMISLGKYGSFPGNLIIDRPYHLTYELKDKQPGEDFSRLRIVPASELHAEVIAEEDLSSETSVDDTQRILDAVDDVEYSLVDEDSGAVVAKSKGKNIDDTVRQTLTKDEIEKLKLEGTDAGKDLIAKLLLAHTALDQKTRFSLSKYKILKTKKYIRRFQVLPLDISELSNFHIDHKDPQRVLELSDEMMGLVGCLGNVHFGGEDRFLEESNATSEQGAESLPEVRRDLLQGRWLVIDDICGVLVGAMAERMGILHSFRASAEKRGHGGSDFENPLSGQTKKVDQDQRMKTGNGVPQEGNPQRHPASDFTIPYSQSNTLTLIHASGQPGASFLNYYGFDVTDPNPPPHPLVTHLLSLSWLQLVNPSLDNAYSGPPPTATAEELQSWKGNQRGNFHRKRRRYARTRHTVDATRAGNFNGLVTASTIDPISILRHTLPLLAGGAPVAIYSPTVEALAEAADCFSLPRRSAWLTTPPVETADMSTEELERWKGNEDFPVNPTLLQGVAIHTSRVRSWQVLPGRTHPLMTERGGAEGYVLKGWRARPAQGKIEARGKFAHKKRKIDTTSGPSSEATGTQT